MFENTTNDLDPKPPIFLFYIMGIWAMITGITGFVANSVAILLFISTKKVILRKKDVSVLKLDVHRLFFFLYRKPET